MFQLPARILPIAAVVGALGVGFGAALASGSLLSNTRQADGAPLVAVQANATTTVPKRDREALDALIVRSTATTAAADVPAPVRKTSDTQSETAGEASTEPDDGARAAADGSASDEGASSGPGMPPKRPALASLPGVAAADDPRVPGTPELDAAVARIRTALPPAAEIQATGEAIRAYFADKPDQAASIAAGISSPLARKLIEWYALKSGKSGRGPMEIRAFIDANPDWPADDLHEAAEEALFMGNVPAADVMAYFSDSAPQTGSGLAALASAHLARGEQAEAKKFISQAWREAKFRNAVEREVVVRFKDVLSVEDHKWRADRILYNDSRWSGARSARVAAAQVALAQLPETEQKKIQARIAAYNCYRDRGGCGKRAEAAIDKLGAEAMKDWGVYYHKLQIMRRRGQETEASELLLKAPTDPRMNISPDDWWVERRVHAYNALYSKKPQLAYDLVADIGPAGVNSLNESRFMAGWISLSFLDKPEQAKKHFTAMTESADGPRTRSTSHFWLGRTLRKLGDMEGAKQHWRIAAKEWNAFYGQLARQTLDPGDTEIRINAPINPTNEEVQRVADSDAVQAIVLATEAGLSNVSRVLLNHLRYHLKGAGEMTLLAHLAVRVGDTQMGVRIGKTGMARGHDLTQYAYPLHGMPEFDPLRPLPEMAIFYAVARQESEFNTLITSGAGARGILQVMRVTADHVCRQYKIARAKCGTQRLTDDPPFNATLATAYIADRHDQFTQSYVLTFPAYNAGPGRANYWIRNIGDPRTSKIDPLDWIELIHIKETRDYVKKVLANVQVYRARLGDEKIALQLLDNINASRESAWQP